MLFKFIVSVVVLLLTFNAADAAAKKKLSATQLQKMGQKAVHKMMHDLVPEPDFAKLTSTKALRAVDVTAYTTGYAYVSLSTSTDCSSTPVSVTGFAVNSCTIRSNYAYKLQLTEDSCNNAQVEYFLDKECTVSAGTGPANAAYSGCISVAAGEAYKGDCTTSSTAPTFSDSVMYKQYKEDTTCASADNSFVAFSQDVCLDNDGSSMQYTCPSDEPTGTFYTDAACATVDTTGALGTTCESSTVDDDDRYSTGDDDTIVAPPSASTTAFPTLAPAPVPVGQQFSCQAKNSQWNSASSVGSLKGGAVFGIVLGTFATMMSLWA